jgi:hypothetical protein
MVLGYVRFRKRLTPNGSANRSLQLGWNLRQLLRQSGVPRRGGHSARRRAAVFPC